jgi:hypothetical protein
MMLSLAFLSPAIIVAAIDGNASTAPLEGSPG